MYNADVLLALKNIKFSSPVSAPLLVSSKQQYVTLIKENPHSILYIGQETNTWLKNTVLTQEVIEEGYQNFFVDGDTTNRPFWKFIKTLIDQEKVSNQVIWANALLIGKQDNKGKLEEYEKIYDISVEYLVYLYQYFHPDKVVIVSGPNNPYYSIIVDFLNRIGYQYFGYPTKEKPVVHNEDCHITWTYHPAALNRNHQFYEAIDEISEYIDKKNTR